MSNLLYTNSQLMLERAMDFQWTKQNVINDNIVNAETPNYKAKYVTFEEALEDAKRKFVGPEPNILALPKTFKVGAVHLCMKDEPYDGTSGCCSCGC